MAWSTPRTWVALEYLTAALFNTHIRDQFNELRGGGLAIASQGAADFIIAGSSTQLSRRSAPSIVLMTQVFGS